MSYHVSIRTVALLGLLCCLEKDDSVKIVKSVDAVVIIFNEDINSTINTLRSKLNDGQKNGNNTYFNH